MVLPGPHVQKGLKVLSLVFLLVCLGVTLYSYFTISAQVSGMEKALLAVTGTAAVLTDSLSRIASISLIQLIFTSLFFVTLAISINYLLSAYFIEKKFALVDELTDLYNRKAMKRFLMREIKRAKRYGHSLSLIMADVDFFKKYNDTNGHVAGDKLLRQMSKIFRKNVRDIDFVGRYGGEEFIIILPETLHEGAAEVAERIRTSVEATEFKGMEKTPNKKVTLSMGLVTFNGNFQANKMIKSADDLLYAAKESGRNMVLSQEY